MVKFHTNGCTWQMLPHFIARIVIRRGDEFEQAPAKLQGAGGAEYLRSLVEKAHVKLDKRSGKAHML